MTPEEILVSVARPNFEEFRRDTASMRLTINCLLSTDSFFGAWFFQRLSEECQNEFGRSKDSEFRELFAKTSPVFRVFRDASKAIKHGHLVRESTVSGIKSIQRMERVLDLQGRWDDDEFFWGDPDNNGAIFVEIKSLQEHFLNDPYVYAKALVGAVLEGCENMLARREEFEVDSREKLERALLNPIFPPPDRIRWIFKARTG